MQGKRHFWSILLKMHIQTFRRECFCCIVVKHKIRESAKKIAPAWKVKCLFEVLNPKLVDVEYWGVNRLCLFAFISIFVSTCLGIIYKTKLKACLSVSQKALYNVSDTLTQFCDRESDCPQVLRDYFII